VILTFAWGSSMFSALSDVRERLDRVFLPVEAEKPAVLRYDPSLDPCSRWACRGKEPRRDAARPPS
jgi:HAE1 family hydrophobic/amphiphilic exporter-1